MNLNNEIIIKEKDLIEFLYNSKKKCFAKTDTKVSLSDGSSVYSNRELPWLYNDIYCGNTVERGTEDIYYDMVLIWSMQYRGGILDSHYETAEAISRFLKYALIETPRNFPIRGPKEFKLNEFEFEGKTYKGNFVYKNEIIGEIKRFIGKEEIYWDDKIVFYHDYIGGTVRNKYFKTKVI